MNMQYETKTMFNVAFRPGGGGTYQLNTTDPSKIGPWLAEMFGIFPWSISWGDHTPVSITTDQMQL